ncbi:MAG: hypothetical protein QM654_11140 [Dysgonamonadaceae bacterium]
MNYLLLFLNIVGKNDFWSGLGILFFAITVIAIIVGALALLIALIFWMSNDSQKRKKCLKVGLLSLLVAGVCLLLTSVLCSW